MIGLIANTLLSAGSLFVTRDKEKGNLVINAAPFLALGVTSISIGCSVSETEIFSECMKVSLHSLMEVFNL